MNFKYILLTVLITGTFSFAYSQQYRDEAPQWTKNTAGRELQIAANHYYIGLGLQTAGIVVTVISESNSYYYSRSISKGVLVGSFMFLAGTFLSIESHSHIKKAGILLDMQNGKKLSLNTSPEGVNLCYQF